MCSQPSGLLVVREICRICRNARNGLANEAFQLNANFFGVFSSFQRDESLTLNGHQKGCDLGMKETEAKGDVLGEE